MIEEHRKNDWAVGEKDTARLPESIERHHATFAEFSPIRHLDAGDPPIFLAYRESNDLPPKSAAHAIHHPQFTEATRSNFMNRMGSGNIFQ